MKITTGIILSAHGIKGEVKVKPETDHPGRFKKGNTFYLEKEKRDTTLTSVRDINDGLLILGLSGIDDRDRAERLRGSLLQIEAEDVLPLPPDAYYFFQLKGMEVAEEDGTPLGVIVDLVTSGANDVYRIDCKNGDYMLIPALKQVIREVDLSRKKMTVRLLPGLKEACTYHEN
ncbi:MAG TPA: ribosome maturation factor RimM [Clostridiales bacterium]|nr:ribosome maturation factor RimM [Clostridiales bacterium]